MFLYTSSIRFRGGRNSIWTLGHYHPPPSKGKKIQVQKSSHGETYSMSVFGDGKNFQFLVQSFTPACEGEEGGGEGEEGGGGG